MPRFSKDPRTFPDVCHHLLRSIKLSPQSVYTFAFTTGRQADQFKAVLNAFRHAWTERTIKLRGERNYSESAKADENYVLLGTYGYHLDPVKTGFSKEVWAVTSVSVCVVAKSDMPVYSSAMEQLTAQIPELPRVEDIVDVRPQMEVSHRLTSEEELETFAKAPLVDLSSLLTSNEDVEKTSPPDPYANFRPEDKE